MPNVLILTGGREASYLCEFVEKIPQVGKVSWTDSVNGLINAANAATGAVRLIAFASSVIVPAQVLARLKLPAVNFHPGPPTYPGSYPESFASYDGVTRFGATAHIITAQVDSGPILAVEWFDTAPDSGRMTLADQAYQAMVRLFARLAPQLVRETTTPPPSGDQWQGTARTRRQFEAMCQIGCDIDAAEYQRRYRAFGEGPEPNLVLTLHGHRFRLDERWSDPTAWTVLPTTSSAAS